MALFQMNAPRKDLDSRSQLVREISKAGVAIVLSIGLVWVLHTVASHLGALVVRQQATLEKIELLLERDAMASVIQMLETAAANNEPPTP